MTKASQDPRDAELQCSECCAWIPDGGHAVVMENGADEHLCTACRDALEQVELMLDSYSMPS